MSEYKNRGALSNPESRFEPFAYEEVDDGWHQEMTSSNPLQTQFFSELSRTIISKNKSPDLGFEQSINPYQGCEHGCIYCYARPSHGYMNLSSGIDFETKIYYKENAAELLEKELQRKSYVCKPILLGANTDPYQPIEAKLMISRRILEVLERFEHPVSIITKNTLIARDMDILQSMAKKKLVKVAVSITTLSSELKRILEPRTSTPAARLRLIKSLCAKGVPASVMIAPVIPLITDSDLEKIIESVSLAGATRVGYVLIRLPYEVKDLFKEWLKEHFPMKEKHVMSIIRSMRGGKEYDASFGSRMTGEGVYAELLKKRFRLACKRFHINQRPKWNLDTSLFTLKRGLNPQQLNFFDLMDTE